MPNRDTMESAVNAAKKIMCRYKGASPSYEGDDSFYSLQARYFTHAANIHPNFPWNNEAFSKVVEDAKKDNASYRALKHILGEYLLRSEFLTPAAKGFLRPVFMESYRSKNEQSLIEKCEDIPEPARKVIMDILNDEFSVPKKKKPRKQTLDYLLYCSLQEIKRITKLPYGNYDRNINKECCISILLQALEGTELQHVTYDTIHHARKKNEAISKREHQK